MHRLRGASRGGVFFVHTLHLEGVGARLAQLGILKTTLDHYKARLDAVKLFDRDVDNLDILHWLVRLVHLDVFDVMDDLQTRDCAAKNGVLLV